MNVAKIVRITIRTTTAILALADGRSPQVTRSEHPYHRPGAVLTRPQHADDTFVVRYVRNASAWRMGAHKRMWAFEPGPHVQMNQEKGLKKALGTRRTGLVDINDLSPIRTRLRFDCSLCTSHRPRTTLPRAVSVFSMPANRPCARATQASIRDLVSPGISEKIHEYTSDQMTSIVTGEVWPSNSLPLRSTHAQMIRWP